MVISADRFLSDLEMLGAIGWVEGQGMDRAAYSTQYAEARSFVQKRMEEGGLATWIDGVGNLFGRIEGSEEGAPAIMAGSHLDAVPGGGKYDGPLGVVAALEAARAIKEQGIALRHPLEVAGFIAEEGGPLGGTFGSRALAGLIQELPSPDLLARFGLTAEGIEASRRDGGSLCCYLELHIEQGSTLERRGIPVGIPTGIVGISRYAVTVEGEANHAGTTPMKERKDAMRAAADLLSRWFRWVDTRDDFVCNVGVLSLTPGSVAVVPGKAEFTLEIRSLKDAVMTEAADKFRAFAADMNRCPATVRPTVWKGGVDLAPELQDAVERACSGANIPCVRMPSGASHDANSMAHITSSGMIFVPSASGISHSKDEWTAPEDLARGAEVLTRAILEADRLFS